MNLMKIQVILGIFLPMLAWANAKVVGNGGNVVVCRDSKGQIVSSEVFDLFEGKALKGLTYPESEVLALDQAVVLAGKINAATGHREDSEGDFVGDLKELVQHFVFLPSGVGLKPIEDGAEFILPTNCQKVQTANRRDDGQIYVDTDIWKSMSETQKAALILHEAIYRDLQRTKVSMQPVEHDSSRTRRIVAHLFAGKPLESIYSYRTKAVGSALHCNTNKDDDPNFSSTYFTVYQDANGRTVAEFQSWLSRKVLTETIVPNYLAPNAWPPKANESVVIAGELESPMESEVKAVIRFDSFVSGNVWFTIQGVPTAEEAFTCYSL